MIDEELNIKIAAINIRGSPQGTTLMQKIIPVDSIIQEHDHLMMLETGCTNKIPDVFDNQYWITNNNFATTAKN